MTTRSIPSGKSKIHRTSENAAARISIPIETLGATDFAAKPTAKCPTNTRAPQLFWITVTYYRNHKDTEAQRHSRKVGYDRNSAAGSRAPRASSARAAERAATASGHGFACWYRCGDGNKRACAERVVGAAAPGLQ